MGAIQAGNLQLGASFMSVNPRRICGLLFHLLNGLLFGSLLRVAVKSGRNEITQIERADYLVLLDFDNGQNPSLQSGCDALPEVEIGLKFLDVSNAVCQMGRHCS